MCGLSAGVFMLKINSIPTGFFSMLGVCSLSGLPNVYLTQKAGSPKHFIVDNALWLLQYLNRLHAIMRR